MVWTFVRQLLDLLLILARTRHWEALDIGNNEIKEALTSRGFGQWMLEVTNHVARKLYIPLNLLFLSSSYLKSNLVFSLTIKKNSNIFPIYFLECLLLSGFAVKCTLFKLRRLSIHKKI
jgi:hypothetical protein